MSDVEPVETPESSGPARRYSWPPFEKGHDLSTRHGAYSLRIAESDGAREIAGWIRTNVLHYHPSLELAIGLVAEELEQYLRGKAALDALDAKLQAAGADEHEVFLTSHEVPVRLKRDVERWRQRAKRDLRMLGLDLQSAADLGLKVELGLAARERRRGDESKLTEVERIELHRLLEKAES